MKLIVKKFMLLHDGHLYKTGDILEVDEKTGREIVSKMNGEVEYFNEFFQSEQSEEVFNGLPEVDLNATVRKKK